MPLASALSFWPIGIPTEWAQASVTEPCARVLAIYRSNGESSWVWRGGAEQRRSARACRAMLTRCLRNPISPTF